MLERSKSLAQVCRVSYPSQNHRLLNCSDFWVGIIEAQLSASPSYSVWWGWAIGVCESLPFHLLKMCFDQASTGYLAELLHLELSSPDGNMFTRISEMLDRAAGTNTSSHSCCLVCFRISVLVHDESLRRILGPLYSQRVSRPQHGGLAQIGGWPGCHTMRRI